MSALAGVLALAGVGADALAFAGGVSCVEMAAPARNRVAAATARAAPDLDVTFMGVLPRGCDGAPPAAIRLKGCTQR